MHIKNPNEQNDFVTGHRICTGSDRPRVQRFTGIHGLVLTLSGCGMISIDGNRVRTERGDLILLKPLLTHRFEPEGKWDLLWFHFVPRPHVAYALEWPEHIPGAGRVRFPEPDFRDVQRALTEAHQLEFRRPRGWNGLAVLLLESVLVRGFNRIVDDGAGADGNIALAQKLLLETCDGIDRIAARCGMSRSALYLKFRKATGVSPRCYREYAMLRRAARLLELSELSVAEIARQVGMPDQYYFSTRFHKFFGFPPREYRRRIAGPAADGATP